MDVDNMPEDSFAQDLYKKNCNGCHKIKEKIEFCRLNKDGKLEEFATCNQCSTQKKIKRQEKSIMLKENKRKINLSSSHNNTNISNSIELLSENNDFDEEFLNTTLDENTEDIENTYDIRSDNNDILLYNLDEVHELINKLFEESEISNESTNFAFEIELEKDLLIATSLDQQNLVNVSDLKAIEKKFYQLAEMLIIPLESGSGYYWEIRKVYLNIKKKVFSGNATIYLGCTMRSDRAWQRSDNQSPKRRSEARAPIERYDCIGSIKLTIVPEQQYVFVKGEHKLCKNKLINPEIHTMEQTYYWITVYNKNTYIMNQNNQLLSAKLYLEKPEFRDIGFKVLTYLENDFIQVLGFLTPLFKHIGSKNITEIVTDFTFKTNQGRFELFVVNVNCKGYVEALQLFFNSLRHEGLQPVFVLTDKDAGQISAISEAWSWMTNIQLCYWHLENAIDKRIKNKKTKSSIYSADKALEVHNMFEFIDPSWIQNNADRLTQIIVEQLVPDYEIKLTQYNRNRAFPAWWCEFKNEWSKTAMTDIQDNIDERYHIDTQRRHDYPLFVFDDSKASAIDPINNPWDRLRMSITNNNIVNEGSSSLNNLQNTL
ncbi:4975_t:CDS:2, partial [Cetraspora pellucida]